MKADRVLSHHTKKKTPGQSMFTGKSQNSNVPSQWGLVPLLPYTWCLWSTLDLLQSVSNHLINTLTEPSDTATCSCFRQYLHSIYVLLFFFFSACSSTLLLLGHLPWCKSVYLWGKDSNTESSRQAAGFGKEIGHSFNRVQRGFAHYS